MKARTNPLLRTVLAAIFSLAAAGIVLAADGPKKPAAGAARRKPDPALQQIEDDPKLPRVLLIGDSISMGYTLPVRALLKDKANVHRPPTNCSSTTSALKNLDAWLGHGKWDVIHLPKNVHFTKDGYQQLGAAVAKSIERALEK